MANRTKNRLFQGDIGNNNTQGKAMPILKVAVMI